LQGELHDSTSEANPCRTTRSITLCSLDWPGAGDGPLSTRTIHVEADCSTCGRNIWRFRGRYSKLSCSIMTTHPSETITIKPQHVHPQDESTIHDELPILVVALCLSSTCKERLEQLGNTHQHGASTWSGGVFLYKPDHTSFSSTIHSNIISIISIITHSPGFTFARISLPFNLTR